MTVLLLRILLALAPPPFRARYGDELLEVHRARARELRGFFPSTFFHCREVAGMAFLVLRLHLRTGEHPHAEGASVSMSTSLETARHDLRLAIRTLLRRPAFSLTVVLILALGIGASTAIFSAANAYFFRPLPFRDADRLVRVYETNPEFGWTHQTAAPANGLDWREQVEAFQDVALYGEFQSTATLIGEGEPELLRMTNVTGNFFEVLGVTPALGRSFTWEETFSRDEWRIILSDEVWRTRFGADPSIVGSQVEFTGGNARVVGVMPPGFVFPSDETQIWTPWGWEEADRGAAWFRRAHWVVPVARLRAGISMEEADAQLQVVVQRLQRDYPETNRVMGAGLMPLRSFMVMDVKTPLLVLLGAVALLLLLACTNVANLMFIRAVDRSREFALRSALGAGRGRMARQLFTESLILALVGGGVGLWLGWVGIRTVEGLNPLGIRGATGIALDLRVVAFALGAALLSGIFSGLIPVLRSMDTHQGEGLKDGGRGRSQGRGAVRISNFLVGTEVALALLLVVGAGLMVRSFVHLRQVDPGFNPEGVLALEFAVPSSRYPERDQVLAFYDDFLARLEARPGILRAGTVAQLPLTSTSWTSQFRARDWPPERVGFEILHRRADRGYFEAMGTPLLRGRLFESTDGPDAPLVVVINETFALEHFPGEDPIGQRIAYDRNAEENSPWYEIIGVVGDQHQVSPGTPPRAEAFESRDQDWGRNQWVVIRTDGDPLSVAPMARELLREVDPLIPLAAVETLTEVRDRSTAREAFLLILMGVFGAVAFLLASVGVYGVTAEAARKRTQEIGIRMALGAADRDVVGYMVRRGMTVVAVGLVVGFGVALVATRALSSLLFNVEPTDPLTLAVVVALLAGSALLASYLPARRASRVDPVEALRAE